MSGKKVLVVDDEPFFVEVLTTRLQAEGFQVSSAKNGEEAVAKAKSEKPLVIVMDVMMPMTSGFEAMQKIRQDPATKNIPAIIFSGKAGMKAFFEEMSGVEFMHKPFDFKILISRVQALAGAAQARADQPKCIVLAGVEDALVAKIRTFLIGLNLQVFTALNEANAVQLIRNVRPAFALCQFWEDAHIFNPVEIAQQIASHSSVSGTPFYIFCKEALSLEAMKHFKPEQIVGFKETSDLLRKVEALLRK
jgi:CheY-like chemotaxis protein